MFSQFLEDHDDDTVAIGYNTPWPSLEDSLYLHNPEQNLTRTMYYNIPYVPYIWVDGVLYPWECYFYYMYQDVYDQRKAVPTEVSLSYAGAYDAATGDVDFTVSASTASELPAGDYRLHIVLTESDVAWAAPNGITNHDHVMRRMYPDDQGTAVTFSGDLLQVVTATVSFTLDPLYVPEQCHLVYFLQENESREVHQAGEIDLGELAGPTGVPAAVVHLELGESYPNPFNPHTTIPLSLARSETVVLEILRADGRRIRVLYSGELPAGRHEFPWDGRDGRGASLASGVYLVRISDPAGAATSRRAVLLK